METVLLVLLVIIITALVVSNMPRLRALADARRVHSRMGAAAPGQEPPGPVAKVPDDVELSMRAQAHREAAAHHARQAAEIEYGLAPAPPPPAAPPPRAAPPPAAAPAADPPAADPPAADPPAADPPAADPPAADPPAADSPAADPPAADSPAADPPAADPPAADSREERD